MTAAKQYQPRTLKELQVLARNESINLGDIDTSAIVSMARLFAGCLRSDYSGIENWDTSRVENMHEMFFGAAGFNADIGNWDTSRVRDMSSMFCDAVKFNRSLNRWDTSSVTDMNSMFCGALCFNQDLNSWDTSKVANFSGMFRHARCFNGDISTWDTAGAANFSGMFYGALAFNRDVNHWNLSRATSLSSMFNCAVSFNQSLDKWDTSSVRDLSAMFCGARSFNGACGTWNTSRVTRMNSLFRGALRFNQNIGSWNTSRAVNMNSMFDCALCFNQDISCWNTSRVTSMMSMFAGAESFDHDLSHWDTSAAANMDYMFCGALRFRKDRHSPDTSKSKNCREMFDQTCGGDAEYQAPAAASGTLRPDSGRTSGTTGTSASEPASLREMVLAHTDEEIEQYCLNQLTRESTCRNKISDFFRSHNYKKAAFDGLTGFTRVLVPFLREHGIETAYIIESSPALECGELKCRVYERELRNIPAVDVIICTFAPEIMARQLARWVNCPVYSVFELFGLSIPVRELQKSFKYNYMYCRDLNPADYPTALCQQYKFKSGKDLDLKNPQNFNEKMQWLKLYDFTPVKTRLADKYQVREFVKEKIGEKYLIPLLGVYNQPEDIDFDVLPDSFVIKCNHGSGMNIIVSNKHNLNQAGIRHRLKVWLSTNYAYNFLELQYKDIVPRIIIEQKFENAGLNDLFDYKCWCFGGKVKYIQFVCGRNNLNSAPLIGMYTPSWQRLHFSYGHPMINKDIAYPDNLEEILRLAETLSAGFCFVRVDFYRLNDGRIYFGEMTFIPMSGYSPWYGDPALVNKVARQLALPVNPQQP